MRPLFRRTAPFALATAVLALTVSIASADGPNWTTVSQDFQGPLFGLNVAHDDDVLLVADIVAGPTKLEIDDAETSLIASLPNVTDVIQTGRREYVAVTGEGAPGTGGSALYRIKNGDVTLIADILAWELENDPDQSGNIPDEDAISNAFDLAKLGRNKFLVADAGGNSVLLIDKHGNIELVATLPPQILDNIPADAVPTTVDVGPDGEIYVGELTGFPATLGTSRIWRIDRDARGVACDVNNDEDDGCTLVNTPPFTSIIDIKFEDGTAYVVELDEANWLNAEGGQGLGGTVNACQTSGGGGDDDDDDDNGNGNGRRNGNGNGNDNGNGNGNGNGTVTWTCTEVATGLPFSTAVAIADDGIFVTLAHSFEGPFEVARLTVGNGDGDGEEDEEEDDD